MCKETCIPFPASTQESNPEPLDQQVSTNLLSYQSLLAEMLSVTGEKCGKTVTQPQEPELVRCVLYSLQSKTLIQIPVVVVLIGQKKKGTLWFGPSCLSRP